MHYEKTNEQLQNLIEIHAMSLLAKEKNYFVPDEKLTKRYKTLTCYLTSVGRRIDNRHKIIKKREAGHDQPP